MRGGGYVSISTIDSPLHQLYLNGKYDNKKYHYPLLRRGNGYNELTEILSSNAYNYNTAYLLDMQDNWRWPDNWYSTANKDSNDINSRNWQAPNGYVHNGVESYRPIFIINEVN